MDAILPSDIPTTTRPPTALGQLPAPEQPKLTREDLLSALDTQIKFEADSQRNEGWTRWAIWGAIAGLVWVGTDLWVQPGLNILRMVSVSLLIFVLWKFVAEGIWVLLPTTRIEVSQTRFRPAADALHPLRPELAVAVAQYLLVIGALAAFKISGQWFLLTYALVGFGGAAFMLCFGRIFIGFPEIVSLRATINVASFVQLTCLAWARPSPCSSGRCSSAV